MLTPETAIYHVTTLETYRKQMNKERYALVTPDQRGASIVAQTNIRDALDRAKRLAARLNATPLLLVIDSSAVGPNRLALERNANKERGLAYNLSYLERNEYAFYFPSMNGISLTAECRSLRNFILRYRKK